MLLRRIIEHVKTQNWTAVALDFAIVVIGVLIAFQITDWNESRQADYRAQILTSRLVEDLTQQRRAIELSIKYYNVVLGYAEHAASVLDESADGADNRLLVSAFRATQLPGYPPFRTAYDELVAAGAISAISNIDLRQLAARLYEPGVYYNAYTDTDTFPYRVKFRKLIPPAMHRAMREQCGDRFDTTAMVGMPLLDLDYECTLELPANEIRQAAASLRDDAEVLETLRLRIADLDTKLTNLDEALSVIEKIVQ